MMKFRFFAPVFVLLTNLLVESLISQELRLATIFSDHMVLQRDKPVPIWGFCLPNEAVNVEFAGKTATARGDAEGKWFIKLEPLSANSTPQSLRVRSMTSNRMVEVVDVLVGEVWLGSGQSNMAMTVSRSKDFESEKAKADQPSIRMFKEESSAATVPPSDSKGRWLVCTPDNVGNFSATLYFFGRELSSSLKVPIGLINSSVGGTPIESWISAEAQSSDPLLRDEVAKSVQEFDEAKALETYEKGLAKWKIQAEKAKALGQPAPKKPVNPIEQRKRRGNAGGLFHGKIAPLIPVGIRGILWYQGEANSQPGKGDLYRHQLPLLVQDWRKRWQEELPFAWVQLPNFEREGDDWMLVREGMLQTLRLPKTGMAITVDIGEAKDIHPKNKQEVGRRLSLWALGEVYRKPVDATSGPIPTHFQIEGSNVIVTFTHAEGGLQQLGDAIKGFEVTSDLVDWQTAAAYIEGNQVFASSPKVPSPKGVRYSWHANPDGNLLNGHQLPASPFRYPIPE